MEVGPNKVQKFASLIELKSIKIFGRISEVVLERLHQKAQMLGTGTVAVYEFYARF